MKKKQSFLTFGIDGHLYLGMCIRITKKIDQNEDV